MCPTKPHLLSLLRFSSFSGSVENDLEEPARPCLNTFSETCLVGCFVNCHCFVFISHLLVPD